MAHIDEHTLELLEFGKVLPSCERLADSDWGRELTRGLRPCPSLEAAELEQQRLREWLLLAAGEPHPPSLALPDLRRLLDAVGNGAVPQAEELLLVLRVIRASGRCRQVLDQRDGDAPLLVEESPALRRFTDLERLITDAIDDRGEVRDDASPELRQLRQTILATRHRLERRLEQIAAGIGAESFVTRRGDRYTVAVPTDRLGAIKGVVHDRSASGASVFLEPLELVEMQNRLRAAEGEETAEILRILRRIAIVVREERTELRAAAAHLARFDSLAARGRWLREMGGTLPELRAGGPIEIRQARHPLLERALAERGEKLVPIDLELGTGHRVLVVTGPNMGGKTVALKTVGLVTVLGMAGLPVPVAAGSRLGFFDAIVADIGDEQSIEQNLSTFASHLRQISAAVEQAGPATLILLDELGAGTDPAEGGALGQAVLEQLAASRALVVVTTHHGELKGMAVRHPTVMNASMAFDVETQEPLYRLVQGIPGRSLALDVAARLGLRSSVLDRARQLVTGDELRLQELIVDLETQRTAAVRQRQAATAERERVASMRSRYQERLDRIRELRERIESQSRRQLDEILTEAREALRAARRAIRQGGGRQAAQRGPVAPATSGPDGSEMPIGGGAQEIAGGGAPVLTGGAAIEGMAARIDQLTERVSGLGPRPAVAESALREEILPGRRFWVSSLSGPVEVESPPDRAGRVRVRRGPLRLELHCEQLEPLSSSRASAEPEGPSVRGTGFHLDAGEPPGIELDLRGKNGDEALPILQRFLDRAVLHNLRVVRIIHGKGTGALRQLVQRSLADHPQVSKQHMGEIWEGGAGVTIVEIR